MLVSLHGFRIGFLGRLDRQVPRNTGLQSRRVVAEYLNNAAGKNINVTPKI